MKHSSKWSELVWWRRNVLVSGKYQSTAPLNRNKEGVNRPNRVANVLRSDQSVFRFLGDKQLSNAQIHFRSANLTKNYRKAIEAQLQNRWLNKWWNTFASNFTANYYKALNISCYLIFDGRGYDNHLTQTT